MVPAERRWRSSPSDVPDAPAAAICNSVFEEMTKPQSLQPRQRTRSHLQPRPRDHARPADQPIPNVSNAKVIINAKTEQRIEDPVVPTATVFSSCGDHTANKKQLVIAAAEAVSHVVVGPHPREHRRSSSTAWLTRAQCRQRPDGIER